VLPSDCHAGRLETPSRDLAEKICGKRPLSRKSDTIFGQGTIPEPSTSHIGKGVALVARTAAFVYIYARISQIAEMTLSFYATPSLFELSSMEEHLAIIGVGGRETSYGLNNQDIPRYQDFCML
jgi:hypothetical protein